MDTGLHAVNVTPGGELVLGDQEGGGWLEMVPLQSKVWA